MSYSAPAPGIALPMVGTIGPWSHVTGTLSSSDPTAGTWTGANTAYYAAVTVPTLCVVRRLWWVNGATVSASYNLDCGIYADAGYKPGARIVSTGSTAQGTASEVQFVDVADTTLAPGTYWLALSCSSTLATVFRISPGGSVDALLKFSEASALPLPATATPAESATSLHYFYGFATTASP